MTVLANNNTTVQNVNNFPSDFVPDLCIYHNVALKFPCPDGLASAWVVREKFCNQLGHEVRFMGCCYDEIPNVTEYENILVVDFSFDVETLQFWQDCGKRVIVVDHHLGFKKKLEQSLNENNSFSLSNTVLDRLKENIYMDIEECGATLTYKLLFPGTSIPPFLAYIKDRDLFTKQLPYCDEVHAGAGRLGRTFNLFDQLNEFDANMVIEYLRPYGEISMQKKYLAIAKYMKKIEFWQSAKFPNIVIPLVILNKSDIALKSDMGEFVCKYFPFAPFCVIQNKAELEYVRLRSSLVTHNTDCVTLFADMNPGGHANAANFTWNGSQQELQDYVLAKAEELHLYNLGLRVFDEIHTEYREVFDNLAV
jgi:hypothetical protein